MKKITLAVPWCQYDPLLKKNSRKTQFVIKLCLLFEKYSGVHNTRIFYFWHWLQTILLCFSQVVLMTSTAGESALFVLRSRTKQASLAPW